MNKEEDEEDLKTFIRAEFQSMYWAMFLTCMFMVMLNMFLVFFAVISDWGF